MPSSASTGHRTDTARLPRLTRVEMRAMDKEEARQLSGDLFARLAELDPADPEYGRVRGMLIEMNLSLVRYVASGYRHRSEPLDDIIQAGVVGLIKAVDGYEPDRGVEFATYALPTISGAIKRFFRDTSWPVHVPRGAQELYLAVARSADELEQDFGRAPTTAEIARDLGMPEADVDEGQRASRAARTDSLDVSVDAGDGAGATLAERLGEEDGELDLVDFRTSVRPLIERLPEREKRILAMRFWGDMTQSQIARRVGVSQMHVSRLLNATMTRLRSGLENDPGERRYAKAG